MNNITKIGSSLLIAACLLPYSWGANCTSWTGNCNDSCNCSDSKEIGGEWWCLKSSGCNSYGAKAAYTARRGQYLDTDKGVNGCGKPSYGDTPHRGNKGDCDNERDKGTCGGKVPVGGCTPKGPGE